MRLSFLLLSFLLCSCGQRRVEADPVRAAANQSAAEASSGMAAAQRMLGASMTPQLSDVLEGSAAFARATMGQDQPPAATWPLDRIVAFPHEFRQAGFSAERHANGTWNLWALGVGLMAVAPVLLYAAKFIPMVGPYVETFGNIGWRMLASRASKDQEEQKDAIYGHASTIFHTAMAALPTDAARTFEARLPRPVLEAIMSAPAIPPDRPII